MDYTEFIKPELLILIPVLYAIGVAVKKSKIPDNVIPLILGGAGVTLAVVYILATEPVDSTQAVFTAIFTAVTQGILCAAASVYANQVVVQASKSNKE